MIIELENKPVELNIMDIYRLKRDINGYLFNNLLDEVAPDIENILNKYLPLIYVNGHTL